MMAKQLTKFNPDYDPKFPGEHLRIFLDDRGIKIVDFARRTGRPTKTISGIIAGNVSITPETALQFERVLGESAGFWLALETDHQLSQARAKESTAISGKDAISWANKFPLVEMVKLKFFEKKPKEVNLVDSILRAFGVSSISAWDQHWHKRINLSRLKQQAHHAVDPFAVAVWLRRAEIAADIIETAPYSETAFRALIPSLRGLSAQPWGSISDELVKICAEVGVAVALVPTVARTGLRGAAYWAKKDKAVIVVSDRMKNEPSVWFSFFHEACHILEHSKKSVFIDIGNGGSNRSSSGRDIEIEADEFSAETLIPMSIVRDFQSNYGPKVTRISTKEFKKFASLHEIAPGLLLVRLQHHDVISHKTPLAKLKKKVEFTVRK